MRFVHVLFGGLGGHSAVVFSLLRARAAQRDDHTVVFFGIEAPPKANEDWCRERAVPFHVVVKRPGLDVVAWSRVARLIRAVAPDCVFLHQPSLLAPVIATARTVGARVVVVEHEPNHLKRPKNWVESVLSGALANEVVFLTPAYAAAVAKTLGLLAPRRTSVIGNAVDTTVFAPAPRPKSPGAWTFGMHARFVATKDQATIVRALARLVRSGATPLRARLAGNGPTLEPVQRLAAELGVASSVEFCGLLNEQQLPGFLNSLDAFVLSTFGETMSTSLMQAMSCGLPCAGSDVGGVNDMIRPGVDGVLFPAGDDAALAALLRKWIDDSGEARRLAGAARARAVTEFDCDVAYARYRGLATR